MPFYPVGPSVFLFLNAKKTKTSANWWQRSEENESIIKNYYAERNTLLFLAM